MTHTTYNNTKSMLIVGSIVALSMIAMSSPAAAYQQFHQPQSNDITVSSENSAAVVNEVMVGANTGYNSIAGGNTGKAGNGGSATGNRANGGNGGNAGSSNNDGVIGTGAASAIGTVNNDINNTRTTVTKNCNCQSRNGGDVSVWTGNNAIIANALGVDANTGDNAIVGGTSGAAGNGGDASSYSKMTWFHHMNNGAANGGNGGNAASSNNLGGILTGVAISDGLVVNVVNRSVTRVR